MSTDTWFVTPYGLKAGKADNQVEVESHEAWTDGDCGRSEGKGACVSDCTNDILVALASATPERKEDALRVLRGEMSVGSEQVAGGADGPLLLGMGAAARHLGVSRATLWKILSVGRIPKVELFPGSYRVRREDLEALAAGKLGMSGHVSRRGRWRDSKGAVKGGGNSVGSWQ